MDFRYAPTWVYYQGIAIRLAQRGVGLRLFAEIAVCNPVWEWSGLFGLSKVQIAEQLSAIRIPQPRHVVVIPSSKSDRTAHEMLQSSGKLFAKPEFGARSRGISVVETDEQLWALLKTSRRVSMVLQQAVLGREYSVEFSRQPGTDLEITVCVEREKKYAAGNGTETFGEIVSAQLDSVQLRRTQKHHWARWSRVVPAGERWLITEFGVHSLGSRFRPVPKEHWAFEDLRARLGSIPGVNFCRVDLIVGDKEYWVLEVNGANAEPLEAYEEPIGRSHFYECFVNSIIRRAQIGAAIIQAGREPPASSLLIGGAFRGVRRYLAS